MKLIVEALLIVIVLPAALITLAILGSGLAVWLLDRRDNRRQQDQRDVTRALLVDQVDNRGNYRRTRPATPQAQADLDACEAIGALPTVQPAHEEC